MVRAAAGPPRPDGTVLRIGFWAAALARVIGAVDAAASAVGLDPAVSGSAAAGVIYAAGGRGRGPAAVVGVRAHAAGRARRRPEDQCASGRGRRPDPRRPRAHAPAEGPAAAAGPVAPASVVIQHAPAAVRATVDLWGPVPSLGLMRAVKDQFDPGHLMAPGRFVGRDLMAQPQGPGQGTPLDPSGELRSLASDCVHCGFCLPSCPTYQLWGEEMDSPRGRIHLITQILDGTAGTAAAAQHLDRCLGCMACVTACPSGVRYDRLIEAARVWAEEPRLGLAGTGLAGQGPRARTVPTAPAAPRPGAAPAASAEPRGPALPPRSPRDRALRAAIFSLFPYPRRLRAAIAPLRAAQRTRLDALLDRSGLADRLPPSSPPRCAWRPTAARAPACGSAPPRSAGVRRRPVAGRAPRTAQAPPRGPGPGRVRSGRSRSGYPPAGRAGPWSACSPDACSRSSSRRSTPRRRRCWPPRGVT